MCVRVHILIKLIYVIAHLGHQRAVIQEHKLTRLFLGQFRLVESGWGEAAERKLGLFLVVLHFQRHQVYFSQRFKDSLEQQRSSGRPGVLSFQWKWPGLSPESQTQWRQSVSCCWASPAQWRCPVRIQTDQVLQVQLHRPVVDNGKTSNSHGTSSNVHTKKVSVTYIEQQN